MSGKMNRERKANKWIDRRIYIYRERERERGGKERHSGKVNVG